MHRQLDSTNLLRTPVTGLVFLAFLAVVLAVFPVARVLGGGVSSAGILAVYLAAVMVVLLAVFYASLSGERRGFWSLIGLGVLLRFVGNVGWVSVGSFGLPRASLVIHDVAYALSYVALLAALSVLVGGVSSGLSRITAIAVLDAVCIALSVGLFVWYFIIGGSLMDVPGAGDGRMTLVFVLKPAADAALLSVALVMYSGTKRPVFVPYLAAAFASLLFADALHLTTGPIEPQNLGGWPEALRAVGFVLLCLGALREMVEPNGAFVVEPDAGRGALSFWFGPLSPALYCGILLLWGALRGSPPSGVLAGSALVIGYLALRSGMMARANRRLRRERERLAAEAERVRISEELHDSLKQELHAIPLLLEMSRESVKDSGKYLDRAIYISRTASERVDFSIAGLRGGINAEMCAAAAIRKTIEETGAFLSFRVLDHLDDSLDLLSPEETLVARQVVNECLWNAAKHSGAKEVKVESGMERSRPVMCITDDGRGFDELRIRPGMGLGLMRRRVREAGAVLEMHSTPGEGTTVYVRFAPR